MELMNIDIPLLTKDLLKSQIPFKQDAKLVAAIDKLCNGQRKLIGADGVTMLPERKLDFNEVQQLLKVPANENVAVTKPSHVLLKETNDTRRTLIQTIEDILDKVNKSAETGDTPKLIIRNQKLWSNCIYDLDRVTLKSFNDAKKTTLCYSSSEDKTRFNTIIFVLTKVHELLSKNLTVTRRELFYQNVVRLRNQANLDVAVRDVCCLLETPPWTLGIVATAKGLIAGPLKLHLRDGSVIDCMTTGGTLIPQDITGIKVFESSAKYILVVEKDAIFQKLLDEGALLRLGPVIIITGKGYPDVCTRQLLCRLCTELRLRALALVDADPHGYEIFLTYKYGSLAQSHLSASLACSSIALLGARYSDVTTLVPNGARLTLTELDKRKLKSLLKRPYLDTPVGARIKQELELMFSSGMKAEIEGVAPTAAALCDAYLPAKLIQHDFLVMENNGDPTDEKKFVDKTRSFNTAPTTFRIKSEPTKRKSFNVNEAVKSLDLALCRLKKSKLVNGEYPTGRNMLPVAQEASDMFMDICASSNFTPGADNSMMSINFSHYDLMRNLSRSNCNSEAAFSGNTCSTLLSPAEVNVKDEHLERYFRSIEMWSKYHRTGGPSTMDVEVPTEK